MPCAKREPCVLGVRRWLLVNRPGRRRTPDLPPERGQQGGIEEKSADLGWGLRPCRGAWQEWLFPASRTQFIEGQHATVPNCREGIQQRHPLCTASLAGQLASGRVKPNCNWRPNASAIRSNVEIVALQRSRSSQRW